MKRNVVYILISLLVLLCGCTHEHLPEAKVTIAEADSMWRAGLPYADSTRMVQAYEALGQWQWFYADEYAHACYHYGRLLREKDNPVEAMQCFINATHSRTRDDHILGRVYSNMGSICHLAGDCPLAYDMYKISADYFRRNHDTILYYYGLNNMAFELAEQGKKKETETLTDSIEHDCNDAHVFAKTLETKAKLYFQLQLYDSVIVVINMLEPLSGYEPTSTGLKARAFWHIGNADSALYYANIVLNNSAVSAQNKYNMLYIISNADSTLSNEDILSLSAQRSDLETNILIPLHNRWAMAVQLLEQDLNREKDWRWLYAIAATILVIGSIVLIYIMRKSRQHQLLSQQVEDMSWKNKEIQQQHKQILQAHTEFTNNLTSQIEQNCIILLQTDCFPQNIHWKETEALCELIDNRFGMLATKLRTLHNLSEREIRLCILVFMGISNSEQLAGLLNYGNSGIRNLKNRTAKKIGTNSVNLRNKLINIAIGEV